MSSEEVSKHNYCIKRHAFYIKQIVSQLLSLCISGNHLFYWGNDDEPVVSNIKPAKMKSVLTVTTCSSLSTK